MATAFPGISQNAAKTDSVKPPVLIPFEDALSAAQELEELDRIRQREKLILDINSGLKREVNALGLQVSAQQAANELLRRAYNTLKTEKDALEAQGKRKFRLSDLVLPTLTFLAGATLAFFTLATGL